MANQEAKNLLDALMGADRNAPLPPGASLPGRKVTLQQKRTTRSCYDPDIDPLYTAWGVDVYDLFTNTKSDLGQNPYIVDAHAHEEFIKLPKEEQQKLGYDFFLFQKLQDLVRQCDRVVNRNKEKLRQEINRKLGKNGDRQVVETVDDMAIDALARNKIQEQEMEKEWKQKLEALELAQQDEKEGMNKLTPLLEADSSKGEGDGIKKEDKDEAEEQKLQDLQMEVGKLTLARQQVVYEVAQLTTRLASLIEENEAQLRNLNYVKSDIVTDKTVCEVSGNFMSSRDADERIAAHYAGKQYLGWKLVRDKFAEMQKTYGRHGPPPPASRRDTGNLPSHQHRAPMRDQRGGGGGGFSRGGGGGGHYGGGGRWERGGYDPPRGTYQNRGPSRGYRT